VTYPSELPKTRSGLEDQLVEQLCRSDVKWCYEPWWIRYTQPETIRKYKPDFVINNKIYIEAKGRFQSADRQKHLLIKKDLPELDIRFVFSNPKLSVAVMLIKV